MRHWETALGGLFFLILFFFGQQLAMKSWSGSIYVYVGERRAPAAGRGAGDYSELKAESIGLPAAQQMMRNAEVERKDGYIGVYLGNPLIESGDAFSFGCKARGREGLYDRVQITFSGVGISAGGESPYMLVDATCEALADATRLDTVWIPMAEILAAKPEDAEYGSGDQDADEESENLHIRLRHIPGEWPSQWVVTAVSLYSRANPESRFDVDPMKMRDSRASLLSFDW